MSGHVLYDYHSNEDDEVTVNKGQKFTLLQTFDDDWWLIRTANGNEGLAPSNYLQLDASGVKPNNTEVDKESKSSPELKRLQVLKHQATEKINALR